MIEISDINEYLKDVAPSSVSELLGCLADLTGCHSLKTEDCRSWSGGAQKIVRCEGCTNFKLRLRKSKDGEINQRWEVIMGHTTDGEVGLQASSSMTPNTCLQHGTWVAGPEVDPSFSSGMFLKPCNYKTHVKEVSKQTLAKHPVFKRYILSRAAAGLRADLKYLKLIFLDIGIKATDDVFKKASALVQANTELSPSESGFEALYLRKVDAAAQDVHSRFPTCRESSSTIRSISVLIY
jgi:hypothetical protein